MDLNRAFWNKNDGIFFENYLESISGNEKEREFEKRVVNTLLPCLGIKSNQIKQISSEIAKGNFKDFINLWLFNNHTEVLILGELICKIDEFDLFKKLLTKYALLVDNWAACDTLKFKKRGKNKHLFLNLAKEFIEHKEPFVRRIGLRILFKFLDDENIDEVFRLVESLKSETHYYVNMCASWLLCDAFIKQRKKTLEFLKENKLNDFVLKKTISKCRDSFRVSKEDKDFLLTLKKSICERDWKKVLLKLFY